MSVNYQIDPYLLCHGNVQSNQLQQQELLIATLKQLAEENKRLLKEREHFEGERVQRQLEIKMLKHNFINLLTLAQHEFNPAKFGCESATMRLTFNEKISKQSYVNSHILKDFNFLQKIRYSTLLYLMKSNLKSKFNSNKLESVFDCRPYNGPKTPPTPHSKYKSTNPQDIERFCYINNSSFSNTANKFWPLEDMLFYLKKYKEEFRLYSGSINRSELSSNRSNKTPYSTAANLFNKPKQQNNKVQLKDDSEFYKDLIEKHKKSLEMIDNVGNQFNQNLCPVLIGTIQTNQISDAILKSEIDSFAFDANQGKNDVYNNYSEHLAENGVAVKVECIDEYSTSISNNINEIRSSTDQVVTVSTETVKENVAESELVAVNETYLIESNSNQISSDIMSDEIDEETVDLGNAVEDGEIIDSGDESKNIEPTNISIKDECKPIKIEARKTISYKIDRSKLKSLAVNKIRKPISFSKPTTYYSKMKLINRENDLKKSDNYDWRRSRYKEPYSSYHYSNERRSKVYSRVEYRSSHDNNGSSRGSRNKYPDRPYYRSRHDYNNI